MSRALILTCSRAKRGSDDLLPALERYDGPAFRVLRRFIRDGKHPVPVVKIISAEYGLIDLHVPIRHYDRRMTKSRAEELRDDVAAGIAPMCRSHAITNVMVWASDPYRSAMDGCWPSLTNSVQLHVASGSIGRRVSHLREWLYGQPPCTENLQVEGRAVLRGVEVNATVADVVAVARRGKDDTRASRFETWYVPVDERKVAPKWLVSKLTGLPVADFRTADALVVLSKLGVAVERVSMDHEQMTKKGRP